jgi:hypothetical protein
LWSVERVGVLFGLSKIGEKDWFRWGLRILHANQVENGSWSRVVGEQHIVDACFALLFLQRVNLTQDLTDKLQFLQQLQAQNVGSPAKKD